MSLPITPDALERLGLIRLMFLRAETLSQGAGIQSSLAILTLQDAVEMFLALVAQQPGVVFTPKDRNYPKFHEYWDMQLPNGAKLTQYRLMDKVNTMRVSFKHKGISANMAEISNAATYTRLFLEENIQLCFSISLDQISMSTLIQDAEVRKHMVMAEQYARSERWSKALSEIALAGAKLFDSYETNRIGPPWRPHPRSQSFTRRVYAGRDSDFCELAAEIDNISEALEILILGVDVRSYRKFKQLTPYVERQRVEPGESVENCYRNRRYIVVQRGSEDQSGRALEDYEYCYHFVVDVAIHMQEFPEQLAAQSNEAETESKTL